VLASRLEPVAAARAARPAPPAPPARPSLVPLTPPGATGAAPPLFLVHPFGGDVAVHAPLARRLGPEQPLYGLRAQGLAGGAPPFRSIAEMASA
jgi:hypothetical protein